METSKTSLIGAVVGVAITLTVLYLAARVVSAGWNASK